MVGWGPGANFGYDQAVANTRLVAKQLRLLLQRLMREAGLKLKDVHLIGHSLGAHTSGDTGRQMGGQIGRITGIVSQRRIACLLTLPFDREKANCILI